MTVVLKNAVTTTGMTYTYDVGAVEVVGTFRAVRRGNDVRLISNDDCGEDVLRLSSARMRRFAAKHKPAQSWYDEDMAGLY